MTQRMGFLEPKYCNINGLRAPKPCYLGPWIRRVLYIITLVLRTMYVRSLGGVALHSPPFRYLYHRY